ncbi:serine/threonine protein kinase [Histomonas meleagridis]|uniref:serine/threonine protein kinase n=1 Tax=Histomonas meleagridis TaxID=135588 RepID=UPI00355A01B7|nr:serine/threonine protein kinase [Histomonas meleagridis]KAH0799615.1 serine/threonine protein kinase [Histomonas meleagridis]
MSRVGSLFQAQKTEGRDVTDLRDLEIVSTTPNSAPNATFLRIPTESCLNHEVYHNTDLAASNDIKSIILLKDFQSKIDKCIYKFYSRRSIMAPLKNYFQSSPCDYSKISQVALLYLKPLMEFLVTTIEHVKDSTNCIFNVFVKTADYSTELLDNIFMLIYKLFCLDSIRGVKKQIYTDLSEFDRIFNVEFPHGNVVDPLTKKWLEDISPVMDSLVSKMKLLPPDKLAHASTSSYRYLLESLQTTPLIYETRYSHIISFAFFVKLCPNIVNPVDIPLVKTFFQRSTCVPLIYEYSYDFVNYFNVTILSDQIQPKAIDLETLHKDLRFKFLDLLTQLQTEIAMSQKVQNRSHLIIITVLSESIKLISSTTNIIREQYSYRIQNPCFEPSSMKPYERTVRHGFTQSELRAILQLLALCRELHDFILGNISVIYQKICNSIHLTFQEFVKNSLEKVYYKIKKNKQYFRNMITYIRTIAGDWTQNEEMLFKKPDAGKHEIHVRIASPSPQLIEFIRIQTQHLLTLILSMSQQIKKRGGHSWVEDCSIILKSFIQTSQNWIELLDLDQTLLVASDQSSFYFKEVQLDLNQEVQFPVRASLPFILCEFALDNYDQPDITDIIFYPLSIYDDAAYISIHKLKSSLIFNEICAEANVCLDTLSDIVSDGDDVNK